jgi:hypothetical protein
LFTLTVLFEQLIAMPHEPFAVKLLPLTVQFGDGDESQMPIWPFASAVFPLIMLFDEPEVHMPAQMFAVTLFPLTVLSEESKR